MWILPWGLDRHEAFCPKAFAVSGHACATVQVTVPHAHVRTWLGSDWRWLTEFQWVKAKAAWFLKGILNCRIRWRKRPQIFAPRMSVEKKVTVKAISTKSAHASAKDCFVWPLIFFLVCGRRRSRLGSFWMGFVGFFTGEGCPWNWGGPGQTPSCLGQETATVRQGNIEAQVPWAENRCMMGSYPSLIHMMLNFTTPEILTAGSYKKKSLPNRNSRKVESEATEPTPWLFGFKMWEFSGLQHVSTGTL